MNYMQERIKVSVIIPTYNRKEGLKELLISLGKQTYPNENFEIIVVDDGSTDGTEGFIKKYIGDNKNFSISYHRQDKAGPGAARNKGIGVSRGEILLFIDTDCIAPPVWVEKITEPFWNDDYVGITGGPDTVPQDAPFPMKCLNYIMTSFLTTGGIRGGRLRLTEFLPRSFNMAVRREVLNKTGKFLDQQYGEDILLSLKIKKAGYKSVYRRQAHVYHYRRIKLNSFLKQVFAMAKGRVIASREERGLLNLFNFIPAIVLIIVPLATFLFSLLLNNFMAFKIYIIVVLMYLILIFTSCLMGTKNIIAALCSPFLFLMQQFSYSFGIISGLLYNRRN